MMFDIVGKRFRLLLFSGIVVLLSIISLLTFGLKPGVVFSSGSEMRVEFKQEVAEGELSKELAGLGYTNVGIRRMEGDFLIRLPELDPKAKTELEAGLAAGLGALEVKEFESVSPDVGAETTRNAAIAVVIAAIGILLYIAWAFRRMPNPFRFGVCAIIALFHDTLIALGVFSILGAILGWEIDLAFVTGVLTVIGYSVNDTVIIYDRIRENLLKDGRSDFEVVVNNSLVETLARSLNTSLTILFTVAALLLFVGGSIRSFAVVLLVGIIPGAYSSICIAPPLLVVWRKGEWRRFLPWLPLPSAKPEAR